MRLDLKSLSYVLFLTSALNTVNSGTMECVSKDLVNMSVFVFVCFSVFRFGAVSLCVKLFATKESSSILRVSRQATCFVKFLYFVVVATTEFALLRNVSFVPKFLGGPREFYAMSDATDLSLKKAPLDVSNLTYGFAIGYHLSSMFYHVYVVERRADYSEMLLHHWLTLFLTVTSLLDSHTAGGSAVMLIHDMADAFVYLSKLFADVSAASNPVLERAKPLVYVALLASFFYLRILCYPYVSYASIILFTTRTAFVHYWLSTIAMYALQVHWFVILVRIGFNRKSSGVFVDMTSERQHDHRGSKAAMKPCDSVASTAATTQDSRASLLGSSASLSSLKKSQ